MSLLRTSLLVLLFSGSARAETEAPDVAFLEWLGQATEVEELGVDINELLDNTEQQAQSESDENNQ